MVDCMFCEANLHLSCTGTESCDCNHQSQVIESTPSPTELDDGELESHDEDDNGRYVSRRGGDSRTRSNKRSAHLKDQQSTGRKRAAKLYPMDPEKPCEWLGRTNCGGGDYPIRGCVSGKQQARHHGPIKDTTINDYGNVHRICHYCHNRWHARNDPGYDFNAPNGTPHTPREMTPEEREEAVIDEMRYHSSKQSRVRIAD